MPNRADELTQKKRKWWPWLLVVAWICFIWGHSLVPGESSDQESLYYVDIVRGVMYELGTTPGSLANRLLEEHPGIVSLLADTQRMNNVIRKSAHFMEYFVLGVLSFVAARGSCKRPTSFLVTVMTLWVSIPSIDEYIQLHVPMRSGQIKDVLLDMGGFASALIISTLIWLTAKAIGRLFASVTR